MTTIDDSARSPRLRSIPHEAEVLLGSSALAHVVTTNSNGTPQVSVVWCDVRGDEVRFITERDTAKVRNLRRNPHVVLSIEDEERNLRGRQHHLVIRGTAHVDEGPNPALFDALCQIYLGRSEASLPLRNSSTAVVVTVTVEHIGGNGPWMT